MKWGGLVGREMMTGGGGGGGVTMKAGHRKEVSRKLAIQRMNDVMTVNSGTQEGI